ncbi:MAG TPA: hypothetical protein VGG22_01820 [Candidatus Baltobacteraceae bacterium]
MFVARGSLAILALLLAAGSTESHQTYQVSGKDSYQIGSRELRSDTSYEGKERLTIRSAAGVTHYSARATYVKTDQGQGHPSVATFESEMQPSGAERDIASSDPDFLTVLNQPFAVQLDAQTLRDVRKLHEPSPFTFTSAMTGATLRGTLFHVRDGLIAGHPVVGIGFDASGPMRGGLPEHPEISLHGTIRMSGRAYYTRASALLLGLDAKLQIAGTLANTNTSDPVKILYRRIIRAE